jgi:DNA-binding NtrC family response regulator
LKLPPRERLEDIEELVDSFLERIARASGQPKRQVSRDVLRTLKTYSWPGNVRELENFIEPAAALSTRGWNQSTFRRRSARD